MKSICSILILMIAVHAQCGVQCLGADPNITSQQVAPTAEQPPCHPSDQDSPRHDHDNSSPCGQAQSMESRIGPISKCVLHGIAIEHVTSGASLHQVAIRIPAITEADGLSASQFQTHPPILRI